MNYAVLDEALNYLDTGIFNIFNVITNESIDFESLTCESCDMPEIITESKIGDFFGKIKEYWKKFIKWIKEAVKKVVDFFKRLGANIKAAFLGKHIDELERDLKKTGLDKTTVTNDLEKAKAEYAKAKEEYEQSLAGKDKDIAAKEKEINDLKNANDALYNANSGRIQTIDDLTNALHKDREAFQRASAKVGLMLTQAIQNKYIFFNPYDYIRDNIDPYRAVNCNAIKELKDLSTESIEDFKKTWEYYKSHDDNASILNCMSDKVRKSGISLRDGGFDHYALNRMIEEDLDNKVKEVGDTAETAVSILEKANGIVEYTNHAGHFNAVIVHYQEGIGILEAKMTKVFNMDFNDPYERKRDRDDKIANIDTEFYKDLREYCRMLQDHIQLFTVLSKFSGYAYGAAMSVVKSLYTGLGITPKDGFDIKAKRMLNLD